MNYDWTPEHNAIQPSCYQRPHNSQVPGTQHQSTWRLGHENLLNFHGDQCCSQGTFEGSQAEHEYHLGHSKPQIYWQPPTRYTSSCRRADWTAAPQFVRSSASRPSAPPLPLAPIQPLTASTSCISHFVMMGSHKCERPTFNDRISSSGTLPCHQ